MVFDYWSGLQDTDEFSGTINFVAHRSATVLASVLIFIPFRQNQKQGLSDGNGPAAFGAIELSGLKLIKIGLPAGRRLSCSGYKTKRSFFHGV